jgi:hypothetical protein
MLLDAWIKRWPYFKPKEVLSPDGLELLYNNAFIPFDGEFLDEVHGFRDYLRFKYNQDIKLLANHGDLYFRGYRSLAENKKVEGAKYSQHLWGRALDLTPINLPLDIFFTEAKHYGFGGVGYYPDSNFVHIDYRPLLPGREPIIWTIQ